MILNRISDGISGPQRLTGLVLVIVNMFPILGVILQDWGIFQLASLYWVECLIIGFFSFAKVIATGCRDREPLKLIIATLCVLAFIIHFGFFCTMYGGLVIELLGERPRFSDVSGLALAEMLGTALRTSGSVITMLCVSHFFSFAWNFLGRREYRERSPAMQMLQPYSRIVLLTIYLIIAGSAITMLGEHFILLVILIGGKTTLDLALHVLSHVKPSETAAAESD